jgi:hypothetical protein
MASRLSQNRAPRECVNDGLSGQSWFPCEERAERGKHSTEVTEVTEGDWVGGQMHLGEDCWLTCGKHAKGESIAQRSRRPQRGIGVGGQMHLGEDRWLTCANTPKGKASHRGHGGHRGGNTVTSDGQRPP